MKAIYDPCYNVWRLFSGASLDGPISIDGVFSWPNLDELKTDLRYKGLALNSNKSISVA